MPKRTKPLIYFACSIAAGRQDAAIYPAIVSQIRCYGAALTAAFAAPDFVEDPQLSSSEINQRDLDWLVRADLLIAEITVPSLGVGYEISKAESWGIPSLCLYRPSTGRMASPMITGARGVAVWPYRLTSEVPAALECFLAATGWREISEMSAAGLWRA